jgi:uridine phosphorylase
VLNYEMEASTLFTMSAALGLRAGCVAGVLVNRTRDEIPADDAAERVESVTVGVVVDAARRILAIDRAT